MDIWLIVVAVVVVLVAALLALLIRRRRRRPSLAVTEKVDLPAAAPDEGSTSNEPPDPAPLPQRVARGAGGPPPAASGTGDDLPTSPVGAPSVAAASVAAPTATAPTATAPTAAVPTVTGPTVTAPTAAVPTVTAPTATASDAEPPDPTAVTVRLPVGTAHPADPGAWPADRNAQPADPSAQPTHALPVVGRPLDPPPAADEPHRHARPDGGGAPPPVAPVRGGGGRHRAPADPGDRPEHDQAADQQLTNSHDREPDSAPRRPGPPPTAQPPFVPKQRPARPPLPVRVRSDAGTGAPPLPRRPVPAGPDLFQRPPTGAQAEPDAEDAHPPAVPLLDRLPGRNK